MNTKVTLFLTLFSYTIYTYGEDELDWPFDQAQNVAAITSHQVVNGSRPILLVVHYQDDDSWAFMCGTTSKPKDLMVVSMDQAINLDPTLSSIANLPPGWSAVRESTSSEWVRTKNEETP